MDLELSGKVAIVTAASKGLGKATALAFAREGAYVVMSARSEALEGTAAQIHEETGVHVLALRGDVTQYSQDCEDGPARSRLRLPVVRP